MEDHEPDGLVERLRRWWRRADRDEEYLAAATDHADLERRIRVLERGSGGPQLVTTMSEWRPGRSRLLIEDSSCAALSVSNVTKA
jgi:hypothetical protein